MSILSAFPPLQEVIDMSAEEIAPFLLTYLKGMPENSLNRYNFSLLSDRAVYEALNDDRQKVDMLGKRLMEAWMWLEHEGFVAPKPGQQGDWAFITEKGKQIIASGDLKAYKMASLFPKDMDHILTKEVRPLFIRGDYDTAIFRSFKEVEMRVRKKASLSVEDYGIDLMKKAFGPPGPLANTQVPKSEQERTRDLYVGAIGVFKNPSSHREVSFINPKEVIDIICFANQLLRMVDRIIV